MEAFCFLIVAVGCKRSAGTDIRVTSPRAVCITGVAPQLNNLPRLWDLMDAPEQNLSQRKKSPSTELSLRCTSGYTLYCK